MKRLLLLGLLAFLVAGCTEDAVVDNPTAETPTGNTTRNTEDDDVPTESPDPITIEIGHDGDVGQGVAVCEFEVTGGCTVRETKPYAGQMYLEANGTVLGGTVTVTWASTAPFYDELGVGVMTMTRGCAGECHDATLAEAEGRSPLAVSVPEADFVLEPEEIVHVYVYALTYRGAGPAGAAVDTGQPIRIDGDITYRPWAAE